MYSNEVEFSLPVPREILSALQKPECEDTTSGGDGFGDGSPARELLLVAERIIPTSSVAEHSKVLKLSLKSSFGKLQTILEGQQLDVLPADVDAMDDVPLESGFDTTGDAEAEAKQGETYSEFESLGNEGQQDTVDGEDFIVVADEASLGASLNNTLSQAPVEAFDTELAEQQSQFELSHESDSDESSLDVRDETCLDGSTPDILRQVPEDSLEKDEAYSELVGELDATVFKEFEEIVGEKESLVKSEEVEGTESQLTIFEGTDEFELKREPSTEGDASIVIDNQNGDSNFNQPDEQDVRSSDATLHMPNQSDNSCHATLSDDLGEINGKTENLPNLDDGKEVFGTEAESDEQSDSDFWNHGEKLNEEGPPREGYVNSKEQNDVIAEATNGIDDSHARDDVDGHATCEGDIQGDATNSINNVVTDAEKEEFEEQFHDSENLEHVATDVKCQKDEEERKDEILDRRDDEIPELTEKARSKSETQDFSKTLGSSGDTTSEIAAKSENSGESQIDAGELTEENAPLSPRTANGSSEQATENSEYSTNKDVYEAAMQNENDIERKAEAELQGEYPETAIARAAQELGETQSTASFEENERSLPLEREGEERNDGLSDSNSECSKEEHNLHGGKAIASADHTIGSENEAAGPRGESVDLDIHGKSREEQSNSEGSKMEDKSDHIFPGKNVTSQGNQTEVEIEERRAERFSVEEDLVKQTDNTRGPFDTGDFTKEIVEGATTRKGKETNSGLPEETWSASSSFGSVKNDEDKANGFEMTEMPTFEEADLEADGRLLSFGNVGDDERLKLNRDDKKSHGRTKAGRGGDVTMQGEEYFK